MSEDQTVGKALEPVGDSGMMESVDGVSPRSSFSISKKISFLSALDELYPDVSSVCARIGIDRKTFENHYKLDLRFQELVDAVREKHVDQIETVRFKMAKLDKGALDRMAVLNAYRSERYLNKTKIEIEHTMNPEEARARARKLAQVLDAEVLETVKRVRARNRGEAAP